VVGRLGRSRFARALTAPGIASLRPISISRAGSISTTHAGSIAIARSGPITISCGGPVTIGRPVTIACSRPVTLAGTGAGAIGLEHFLPLFSPEILPGRLSRFGVGLCAFLAHLSGIVFHTVTVVRIVLPLREIVHAAAIEVVYVHVPAGHVDVVAAPVAVAPEGMASGNASGECNPCGKRGAGNVAVRRREIVRRIVR